MLNKWRSEDPDRFGRAMVRLERRAVRAANPSPFLCTVEGFVMLLAGVLAAGMVALLWSNGWKW